MRLFRGGVFTLLISVVAVAGCGGGHHKTLARPHPFGYGIPPHRLFHAHFTHSTVPSVEQFDSIDVSTVPGYAQAVAGYVGGSWPTFLGLKAAFPHAYAVSIAVNASERAMCLDVEPGDASPSQVVAWYWADRAAGFPHPCFYSALFNGMQEVAANLQGAGLARSSYVLWDADWTYAPGLDLGYDCTQWSDRALNLNLDESTCARSLYVTLGLASPPAPAGPSRPQIRHWYNASAASLRAYDRARCSLPVLGPRNCGMLAWRTLHFQTLLWPTLGRPHCFGRHAHPRWIACRIERPSVAVWSRARNATWRAVSRDGCDGAEWPNLARNCQVLRRRAVYFERRIRTELF